MLYYECYEPGVGGDIPTMNSSPMRRTKGDMFSITQQWLSCQWGYGVAPATHLIVYRRIVLQLCRRTELRYLSLEDPVVFKIEA